MVCLPETCSSWSDTSLRSARVCVCARARACVCSCVCVTFLFIVAVSAWLDWVWLGETSSMLICSDMRF